ncbi:putative ArsR family transcriptional regulator [Kribbella aluminosa]|uniref:ArsR family transcriptional regulator n=1 Tax=Kribbella aluminosa TaxID=416017 RepID=A0ABS4UYR2_9ACTN|nr:helix-turn-helix domain-containing protein [Kribbella aluminosa]MBP2356767.1 putative ArsR family transcriptional regulator [Kribbella aluminosa]
MDTSRDAAVQAVAVLEEPTRRRLYEYVVAHAEPVSRDDAASALGIPRTTAAFHLDRLTGEGLLETCYERRTGRTGPGAGRPAKLYHRSDREIEISLPERQYAVAGQLLAAAIQDAETGTVTPREAANRRAHEYGRSLGRTAAAAGGSGVGTAAGANGGTGANAGAGVGGGERAGGGDEVLVRVLEGAGFEPRVVVDGIALANCPFRRLAKEHPQLVCGMNLHLVAGVLASLDVPLRAELAPTPGHCCVRLVQSIRG